MSKWRMQLELSLFCWWLFIISYTPLFGLDRDIQIDQLHHTAWTADNAGIGETKQIVQTSDGFLWLLTSDDRLLRFDGVRFEPIETAMAGILPTGEHRWDDVFSITAVPDGGLWIGHALSQIDLLKNGQVHTFSTQNCSANAHVDMMVQDQDGVLWIATPRGLGRLQNAQCDSIGPGWGYSGGEPIALLVDRGGTLWVKSQNGRLFFLRRGAKSFEINASGSGDSMPEGSLAQAPDGSIWQASPFGIQRILQGPGDRAGIRAPMLGPHAAAARILFDREGALWFAMADGLHRIAYPDRLVPWQPKRGEKALTPSEKADSSSQTFTVDQGLSSNNIWNVFQDREGNIWTATGAGIDRFRNNALIRAPVHPPYAGQLTFAAGEHGTVWAAGWAPPLFNLGERVLSTHTLGENISALYRDPAGVIWVGTLGKSIWRSSGSGFVRAGWPAGEGETYVRAMSMDHAGGLWVSLATGEIFRLADGVWTRQNDRLGIPVSRAVYAIATDDHGRVWFNAGRVYVLDGNEVQQFDPLKEIGYVTLIEVKGPHTWLGGLFGLTLLMNGHFQVIKGANGEVFRVTSGIIERSDGDVWLNTESGVVRIPAGEVQRVVREPAHPVQFQRFDTLDGLEGKATYWIPVPTAIAGLDGKLWFSTSKGIFWADPERIARYRNLEPPPVHVEQITADHTTYNASSVVTSSAKGSLRLPPQVRDLEIDYTALSFVAPEKVLFRYKLEGWDRDWQDAGTRRQAFYSNLPPRSYTFRVMACNNSGLWNEAGASLDFFVAPAYYQTNWFRLFCAAAFFAVLWALHRWRVHRLISQEKHLRDVVETIPAMTFTALSKGSATFVNKRWTEYTGLSVEQSSGTGWQRAIHADDLGRNADKWRISVTTGQLFEDEARFRRAVDGEYRWFLVRGVPLRDRNRRIVRWYGTLTDIEDRKRAEEALGILSRDLQDNKARLEEAQRITHVGYWERDLLTDRITWSDETYRIYGLQPQEHPMDLNALRRKIHPEDWECVSRALNEALTGGPRYNVEYRVLRPTGELRTVHSEGDVKKDASGRPYQMFGIVQDITDRKRAVEALKRGEFYLREGERLAHMGSWAFDPSGFFDYWSQELFQIYGLDPQQGAPTLERYLATIHPQDRESMAETIKTMIAEYTGCDAKKRIIRPDGEQRYIRCVGIPVVEGEVLKGFVGTAMDVTEQELLTQEVERQQAYLTEAQKLTHTGSWAWRVSDRNLVHLSEEWYRVFGHNPSDGAPNWQKRLDLVHPDDRLAWQNTIERAIVEKTDYDMTFRIVLPGGIVKWIHTVGHPVLTATGDLVQFLGSSTDITDQKRAEHEREKLQLLEDELAHINRVSMMGEMAASLAHEIKQPIAAAITSANSCIEWLSHEPPNIERARATATRIDRYGRRAAEIIDRIRSFYRKSHSARELVDVNGIINEMLALLQGEATRFSIEMRTELAIDLPEIMADRIQLQQVFMNLMLNAIEAMNESGGELTVRSQLHDGQLLCSVSDTGPGLPAGSTDYIFSAFFTTKPQGSGMGLAISRTIVESHGGRLWATANDGGGAAFHFALPTEAA
jgi:PAS domain S-box-containing protein